MEELRMSGPSPLNSKRPFFEMCATEPFRIFFPLGILVGISGVSLWPLFFSGIHHSFYPGVMHARLMIEGFLGAFVLGFLGAAFPRFVDAPHLTRRELGVVLLLYAATVGIHIAERPVAGDAVFILLQLVFGGLLLQRFLQRKDMPPPGFVLLFLGFLGALAGAVLSVIGAVTFNFACAAVGKGLLNVGWLVLHILGLGSVLLARFFKLPQPSFPESRRPSPEWWTEAGLAAGCGATILATLVFEPLLQMPRLLGFIRWAAATAFLARTVPFFRAGVPKTTITQSLRTALEILIAGLLFPVCFPMQSVAGLHLLFIGTMSLLAITVATRVIFGHSGWADRCSQKLNFLFAATKLVLTGMTLRVLADFFAAHRPILMDWASITWIVGLVIWAIYVLPRVRVPDPEA